MIIVRPYAVSGQIIPALPGQWLGAKDPQKAQNVMQAMLKMRKIDIAALRQADEQK